MEVVYFNVSVSSVFYFTKYAAYQLCRVLNCRGVYSRLFIFSVILAKSTNLTDLRGAIGLAAAPGPISQDYYLHSYLAGLIEGDGHFNVPKILKDSKGKSRSAGIEVIFALKDRPSAELLKNKFGGNVYLVANKNLVR